MSRVLTVFYTRTQNSKKAAEQISVKLNSDLDEIVDKRNWKGILGFISGGFNAVFEKQTKITYDKNPEKYDVVIIVSPVWASKMPPAIRTYINENKDRIKNHAFLLNNDGSDIKKALNNFNTTFPDSIAEYGVCNRDVDTEICQKNFEEFADKIRRVLENGK